ncbi:XRE family transcriptional regulator, partial [Dysosmobacter welbionis]
YPADLRQGEAAHLHRDRRRHRQDHHELFPGGESGHQHPRRTHLHAMLLSGDRGAESVLRVEILAPEATVSRSF